MVIGAAHGTNVNGMSFLILCANWQILLPQFALSLEPSFKRQFALSLEPSFKRPIQVGKVPVLGVA